LSLQTVENFFDLGFLVKDGRVAMQADAGAAYVVPSKPPLADAYDKGLLKTQNILKLDYATYRQLVARWSSEGAPYLASRGSLPPPPPPRSASGEGDVPGEEHIVETWRLRAP
jgi:hypothetical protein